VTTQCCESIAVATQTLLAREFGKGEKKRSRKYIQNVIKLSCYSGGILAAALSMLTYLNRSSVISKLTPDSLVGDVCGLIFPAVLVCQAFKGLAYPANGVVMGGSDWTYSMLTMGLANVAAVGALGYMGRNGGVVGLKGIWWVLAGFMGTQVRVEGKRPPVYFYDGTITNTISRYHRLQLV
jgi:Na+-driven multidrug efflux pump